MTKLFAKTSWKLTNTHILQKGKHFQQGAFFVPIFFWHKNCANFREHIFVAKISAKIIVFAKICEMERRNFRFNPSQSVCVSLFRWYCYHRVHRVATATFWRTFHHDGKIAQPGVGGGGFTPTLFHYIYHHVQSCGVGSSLRVMNRIEWRHK